MILRLKVILGDLVTLIFTLRSIAFFFSESVSNAIVFIGEIQKLLSFIVVQIFAKVIKQHCDLQRGQGYTHRFVLTESLVLFGMAERVVTDPVMDYILLVAKFFVYSCTFKDSIPTLENFVQVLKFRYKIEKNAATRSSKIVGFEQKWMLYMILLNQFEILQECTNLVAVEVCRGKCIHVLSVVLE